MHAVVLIDDDHGAGLWGRLRSLLPFLRRRVGAETADEGDRQSRFLIEPLEPRILLSGDPIASELARLVDDAGHATFVEDHAAIVEKVAVDATADAGHADYDAQAGAFTANAAAGDERGVQWPTAWLVPEASDQAPSAVAVASPAQSSSVADVAVSAAAVTANEDLSVPVDGLPLESATTGMVPNSDADMPRGPPAGADPIRGPPVTNYLLADVSSSVAGSAIPLSASDLQSAADAALTIWSNALAAKGLAFTVGAPTFLVDHLGDGILGSADGSIIRLDIDAAGHGWFVDATPFDASEFPHVLGAGRFGAAPGSAAAGAMDLLTVLLHEIGHWAGYDHDSGIALMTAVLGAGQRVTLDLGGATPAAAASVSGLSFAGTKVSLTTATAVDNGAGITVTINSDGSATVTGSTSDNGTLAGVTEVEGNPSIKLTLVGPSLANIWTLNGPNSGSLTSGNLQTITFTGVAAIVGGEGDDRVVVGAGASGLASFDGEGGFDSIVNRAGAPGTTTFSQVENFIDRPLLFIPGFAGSFVDPNLPDLNGQDALEQWYLTRGIDPTKLVLEPLTNGYSDLVQTLVNAGYTDGTNKAGVDGTLYVSLWDWRVPVAVTSDGTDDGKLSDVDAASLLDWAAPNSFESGLEYLAYWMDQAAQAWDNLTGAVATSVDLITHSTGGLIARSYLQSVSPQDQHIYDESSLDNLLPVNTLIQTGVPNQGTGGTLAVLANDFGLNVAVRGGGNLINSAYELLKAGKTIANPDGSTISNVDLPTPVEFISQYVATFKNLLATYPFLDATEDGVEDLVALAAADGGNTLLLDLNANGPADFVGAANSTYVVYSDAVDTPDVAIVHTGVVPSLGLQNEILPFDRTIGRLPGAGEQWYEIRNAPGGGDGTVPAFSASNGFELLTNSDGTSVLFKIEASSAGGPVTHTEIQHNEYSQRQILRLLGVDGYATVKVSTDLLLDTKEQVLNLIALGVVDPIDVARSAFSDAKDVLADIETRLSTALTEDLPLIGMSLNDLLTNAGFDLFGEFEAAVAPAASALSDSASLADRFAELEGLLETAFGVGDDAIEIVYDEADVRLDIVFDFNFDDVATFALPDFNLNLDLGLAFTLGIDFGALIASAAGGSGDNGVRLSLALTGAVEINTGPIDFSGSGSVAIDLREMLGGSAPSVTFEVTGELDVADAIQLDGVFGFERRTGESLMLADGSPLNNVDYTLISGAGLSGFFGVNGPFVDEATTPDAMGLSIGGIDFALLLLEHGGIDYTAFTTSGGSATLVGVPGLTLGASSISVAFNSTSDAANPDKVLDFDAAGSVAGIEVVPNIGPALDLEGENGAVLAVSGDIALDGFGFVVLAGTFEMAKQTGVAIDDGSLSFNADVLSLALTASGFVGSGASLGQDPDASTATVVTTDAIGFSVPSATLDLVLVKDRASTNKYTGLQVSLTNAGLVGIAELGLTVSGTVQVNKGPAGGARLDWSQVTGAGNELPTATLAMSHNLELAATGTVWVDLFGFLQAYGDFALSKFSTTVTLAGESTQTSVDVLTFGMNNVNVFVGAGPYFQSDGTLHADSGNAIGLEFENVSLALALFKRTAGPGSGSYYAFSAFAQDFTLVGLEDLGDSPLDASGYRIEVNGGKTGAINFAAGVGPGHDVFEVATGPSTSAEFHYRSALQRVALENATLTIGEYVYISGGFSFTRQTSMDVALSGGSGTDRVDVFAIGAGNVDVFVGSGPYFIEGSDVPDPGAVGLVLENVNFGILLMKSTNTPSTKYTALKATADHVGLVGLDSLVLSASGIDVEFNSSKRADGKVVDFHEDVYKLDTGSGELEIDYATKLLRASVDDAKLQIGSYVFISGGLAFEKGTKRNVSLTSGMKEVTAIDVGAEDLTMFFGVDGPYWNDLDHDQVVEDGETNPNAMGFAITNANLAMTLMKAASGDKYLALHATADQVGFVGIKAFQLEASKVEVDLNLALGAGVTSTTPVVNFAGTFSDNEYQALFDVFDSNDDGEISPAELAEVLGASHVIDEPLTTAQELVELLNAGGAPPDGALLVTDVVGQLSESLSDTRRQALEALILAADLDGDGKFDPIGYEIKTGSGSLYLSAEQRQIHASADNVLINVDQFLYVKGSIALDIGSRETVTIRTGIPASVGALSADAVTAINNALLQLKQDLADLKSDVRAAIEDAIDVTLRGAINGLLDGVIDAIVDYLKVQLAGAVGSVGDLTSDQLNAAIAAVRELVTQSLDEVAASLSVDGLLDQLIDPIVSPIISSLPGVLQTPVRGLLESLLNPIRDRVLGEFGATIQQALDSALNGITASVSKAVDAALQAFATKAAAGIDEAADEVRAAIRAALDPQFDRLSAQLDKLLDKAVAGLDPLFLRLEAITELNVGDNFSTIDNVEVEVTALGISNATAFVGLPPAEGFDFSKPLSGQISQALGLYIEGFTMGLAIFKPVLADKLPTFTALKIHADEAGFSDGDPDQVVLELVAKMVDVELNLGGPIVEGAGPLFGNATIDFVASFPNADPDRDGYRVQTGTTTPAVYLDFVSERILASVKYGRVAISEFVYVTGSFAFEKGSVQTVDVYGGLTGPALDAALSALGISLPDEVGIPATGAPTAELSFMTIGASNVHAFIGLDGPYWTDSETAPNNTVDDGELNPDAKGLWIKDFDFGMAIMQPTNKLDFVKYFALKATADQISLVGIPGVEIDAHDIVVEVNQSSPGLYGVPLFPVVNFEATYGIDEQQGLFAVLNSLGGSTITAEELLAAFGTDYGITGPLTTVQELVALLNVGGAPPAVKDLLERLDPDFRDANLAAILAADVDGDGKFDPSGYEVNTGSTPVYLGMKSSLIRAQGFLQLNLFDTIFLTGSVAFELGPTRTVTLTDDGPDADTAPDTKEVTTMTIGASDITAFIGVNGPYWVDLDGDHKVSWADANGQPLTQSQAGSADTVVDANETAELNDDSVGFHITDLDVGFALMASTNPQDVGVYLAGKLNVHSFGLIGIDGLTATGAFDVALNVGIGLSGLDPNLAVVDFPTSFSEVPALFALMDTSADGTIDQGEQIAALAGGYTSQVITTAAQLVAVLNAANGPPDAYLTITEVRAKLNDTFENDHQAALGALDADGNGRLNTGFEINTGNPAAPAVVDFNSFLVSIRLGGKIELQEVFRLNGVFLFEADSSSLKAFFAAGLEIGPDMAGGSNAFTMNALGALVITDTGIAADIDVSVSIGGALSDVLQLDARARLVFNTTGEDLTVHIPAKYVDFLLGTSSIPPSESFDSSEVSGLTFKNQAELEGRFSDFEVDAVDGSASYTIKGTAPGAVSPGPYFVAIFDATLTILRAFEIDAHFKLSIAADKFELGFAGNLKLGGFGSFHVDGNAVIDDKGFAARGALSVNINLAGLVDVSGSAELKINTGSSATSINGLAIEANTYKVIVDATVKLFGVVEASGKVEIGVENGVFKIAVNKLAINLFDILKVDVSGYMHSDGQFKLAGSISLGDALKSADGEWGITGGISLSISNSGFSGHGSVRAIIFGKSFNIASASLSLETNPFSVLVRAEGPLGVYIVVTIDDSGIPKFGGGLGFLDDLIDAVSEVVGEVIDAVGDAVVQAANAVAQAFEDLGEAILDLGAAIGDALEGFVSDIGDLIDDIGNAIAEAFSSSRTVYRAITPTPKYSYSADWLQQNGVNTTTLVINMNGGSLTDVESPLALAFVNNKLVVDGPNSSASVTIAQYQKQERSWDWESFSWGSWRDVGAPYGEVKQTIEYSNMMSFGGVTKVIIYGTNAADTIVLDTASITIPAEVYGYGGADTIVTAGGNDYVDGGDGDDIISTYAGNDVVHGGAGNDILIGGVGNDDLYGEGGNDLLNES